MKIPLPLWILLGALTITSLPASAPATPPARRGVELALSTYEKMPSKAALLHLFGPEVASTLQQIVARPSRAVLARVRALTALGDFPSTRSRELLRAEIAHTKVAPKGLPLVYLEQALRSYAILSKRKGLPVIAPLLSHPSIDVRVAAGEALRLTGAPEARALIATQAHRDPSATVRAELGRQLALIDKKPR